MRFLLCSLMLSLIPVSAAYATVVRAVSVQELTHAAAVVAVGSPVSQQSYWEGGRIFTRVKVNVHEVWRGATAGKTTVEVVTFGGTVGDIAQRVDGAAVLPLGDRLVLFLNRDRSGILRPEGLWQGVYRIGDDAPDPIVTRVVHPAEATTRPSARGIVPSPIRLSELRRLVQQADGRP